MEVSVNFIMMIKLGLVRIPSIDPEVVIGISFFSLRFIPDLNRFLLRDGTSFEKECFSVAHLRMDILEHRALGYLPLVLKLVHEAVEIPEDIPDFVLQA